MVLNFKILKQLSQELSVLYVEDDSLLREQTTILFKNIFHLVDTAVDGQEGLDKYIKHFDEHSKNYNIIISDIQMPNLNGIELTREILTLNKNQKIIIISAHNDKEYLIDLINLGVNGFMQKPLQTDNMLQTLFNVCSDFINDSILILQDGYSYDTKSSTLYINNKKIELSENELRLLELLIFNKTQSFSAIEIFNHLYIDEPQKEFSSDAIKSLIKRLRKKTPEKFIVNTQQIGYSVNF